MTYPKPLSEKTLEKMYQKAGIDEKKREYLDNVFKACANLYGAIELDDVWRILQKTKKSGIKITKYDLISFSTVARREDKAYRVYEIDEIYTEEERKDKYRTLVRKDMIMPGSRWFFFVVMLDRNLYEGDYYMPKDILSYVSDDLTEDEKKLLDYLSNLRSTEETLVYGRDIIKNENKGRKLSEFSFMDYFDTFMVKDSKQRSVREYYQNKSSCDCARKIFNKIRFYDNIGHIAPTEMFRIILNELTSVGAALSEDELNTLLQLMMDAYNNSKHWCMKGWAPSELHRKAGSPVPRSVSFGPGLQQAFRDGSIDRDELTEQMKKMGFDVLEDDMPGSGKDQSDYGINTETDKYTSEDKKNKEAELAFSKDDLYDAAFQFKKTKMWKKLEETDIFAVELGDGSIGYVCIIGHAEETIALMLYRNGDEFNRYRDILDGAPNTESLLIEREQLHTQSCLQMMLDEMPYLSADELKELRDYTEKKHIRLTGRDLCPQFIEYLPHRYPWPVTYEKDMKDLCHALNVAVLISKAIGRGKPGYIGITGDWEETGFVPVFRIRDGKAVSVKMVQIPERPEKNYEKVTFEDNDFTLLTAKKLKKKGTWEAEYTMVPEAVATEDGKPPVFFPMIITVDNKTHYNVCAVPVDEEASESYKLVSSLVMRYRDNGAFPRKIACRDERTYALLEDLCLKTGTEIYVSDNPLHALDEFEDYLLDRMGVDPYDDEEDDDEEILDFFLNEDPDTIREFVPKEIIREMKKICKMNLSDEVFRDIYEKIKDI